MTAKSNNQGRAYEFAWINTLSENLSLIRDTKIVDNSSFLANKNAWNSISKEDQTLFKVSAEAAVQTILDLEPLMSESSNDTLFLEFQKDGEGIQGDVRDIVIKRNNIKWEIGLSIKHNHEAIKHSRLSHQIDFGYDWFGIPCSENYWSDVEPIFNKLKQQKEKGMLWKELSNKEDNVYKPILDAFIKEINRSLKIDPSLPRKMIEYLIGVCDYYKVISRDDKKLTVIRSFNIHGTLNKPGKIKVSAFIVPIVNLPTEIVMIKPKTGSKTTVEIYMNNGWQLSFRIHNASSKIESSLKFDIQFVGMPASIMNIECKWH